MSAAGWDYFAACSDVLRLAQAEDPRRQILGCTCGALYLTGSRAPDARECGYCYRRWRREADEAEDRRVYQLYLDGQGGHPFPVPVESEPQVQAEIQGVLF